MKFTPRGSVTLTVRATGERLRFTIADTGIGMSLHEVPRLFQPFGQADTTTMVRFGGTGLGLHIANEIVRAMGGTIAVESEVGKGTTMSFAVPLPAAARPPQDVVRVARPLTRGLRVLVVDDDVINRLVTSKLLERLGAKTTAVGSGTLALSALEAERFNAVLLDRNMPELDGLETARRLRARAAPTGIVPVVAVTASALPEVRAEWESVDVHELLIKPFSSEELADALQRALHHTRA